MNDRDARQIVRLIKSEVRRLGYTFLTDGKVDLTKTVSGQISGTETYGGSIASGAIYNRHINPNAQIDISKLAVIFLSLSDTPSTYIGKHDQVATVNLAEDALEFRATDYIDGGRFIDTYETTAEMTRSEVDGGSFVEHEILNGGVFV